MNTEPTAQYSNHRDRWNAVNVANSALARLYDKINTQADDKAAINRDAEYIMDQVAALDAKRAEVDNAMAGHCNQIADIHTALLHFLADPDRDAPFAALLAALPEPYRIRLLPEPVEEVEGDAAQLETAMEALS